VFTLPGTFYESGFAVAALFAPGKNNLMPETDFLHFWQRKKACLPHH
jgi:hypothetical protein